MRRFALLLPLALVACSAGAPEPATPSQEWQGSVTEEGDATLVHNAAGSVWGGPSRLVEEASIGAADGDEPYLFGSVVSVTATADRIIVADRQIPAVRVYDFEGRHLHDLGRAGEGPGEYEYPHSVRVLPDGRVVIRSDRRDRMLLYDVSGELLEEWPAENRISTLNQLVIWSNGDLLTYTGFERDGEFVTGMRRYGPEGPVGEIIEAPYFDVEPTMLAAETEQRNAYMRIPMFPSNPWRMGDWGRLYYGEGSSYEFTIQELDPHVYVVSRDTDGAPISREEAQATVDGLTTWARQVDPAWSWDLPEIPETWPAYRDFHFSADGAVWLLRNAPSRRRPGCTESGEDQPEFMATGGMPGAQCWIPAFSYDVFDSEGRFLTEVAAPDGFDGFVAPHIDGDVFIGVVRDDNDVAYVKRYRVVRPR